MFHNDIVFLTYILCKLSFQIEIKILSRVGEKLNPLIRYLGSLIYINDGTLTVYEFLVQGAVACVEYFIVVRDGEFLSVRAQKGKIIIASYVDK